MIVRCHSKELLLRRVIGLPSWHKLHYLSNTTARTIHFTQHDDDITARRKAFGASSLSQLWHAVDIKPIWLLSAVPIRIPTTAVTTGF
jgi:hypothetical protein